MLPQQIAIEGIFDYNNGASTAGTGSIVFGKEDTYTSALTAIKSYIGFETINNNTTTEKARIDSSGRLLVGTSTASGTSACSITATAGVFSTDREGATIANGASISVTVPTRGGGACYLVTASRRQGTSDNFQGLFLVHYSSNSSPQAVITINALSSMTLSAATDQITLTNGLGFNTAATLSAVRIG